MGISKPIDDVIFDFKHIIRGGMYMNKEEQILQAIASLSDRMDQKIENLSAEMSAKKEPAVKNEKSLFL